ncbi:protein PHYLLO chloroplastic-like, partial [Trifolium pratense]
VMVPPSPKALSWFCCQPESSGVYPLIFISKNMDNPTCKSLYVNGSRGVFGIGAAVSFVNSSSRNKSLIKRYISTDSTNIVAYGFMDVNLDNDSISMNHEDGCFSFFIPQVELDEMESVSILTMTLAWDNFSLSNFGKALHLLEVSLNQCYELSLNYMKSYLVQMFLYHSPTHSCQPQHGAADPSYAMVELGP